MSRTGTLDRHDDALDEDDDPPSALRRAATRVRRVLPRALGGGTRDDEVDDDEAIDPRIEARRAAVVVERRSRLRRRLLAAAIVVTVIAAAYGVTRSRALDVDTITVTGTAAVSPDEARVASGIRVGDRLTDVDAERAEEQLRALPWVRDAVVERSWRGGIDIRITERTPVVAVPGEAPSTWWLVDADRRVLGPTGSLPTDLPVIGGAIGAGRAAPGVTLDDTAANAIAVARALTPGLRSRVETVRAVDATNVDLDVRPAGVVHLGSTDRLGLKVQSMQTLFGQVDLHCLAAVDLRVADAPVLTRVPACA